VSDLTGRQALVTGVSRRVGIAYAVALRLLRDGADVVAQSWEPHDAAQPWGADPLGAAGVVDALRAEVAGHAGAGRLHHVVADLGAADAPGALIAQARDLVGGAVDVVVACHARSSDGYLADATAEELDACWAVNTRSVVLLAQALARQPDLPPGGRFVSFTSGQHSSPMTDELPYALSKAALAGSISTLAASLAALGCTANCIDPGPTDTGYATGDGHAAVAERMPFGRWGQPSDAANLVAWLVGPEGGWVTGQLLVSDGGWMLRGGVPQPE
jgi:3-oxoacyl-[acyl-carrier protein] reductase